MVCRVSVFVRLSGVLVLVGYHELIAVNLHLCLVPDIEVCAVMTE